MDKKSSFSNNSEGHCNQTLSDESNNDELKGCSSLPISHYCISLWCCSACDGVSDEGEICDGGYCCTWLCGGPKRNEFCWCFAPILSTIFVTGPSICCCTACDPPEEEVGALCDGGYMCSWLCGGPKRDQFCWCIPFVISKKCKRGRRSTVPQTEEHESPPPPISNESSIELSPSASRKQTMIEKGEKLPQAYLVLNSPSSTTEEILLGDNSSVESTSQSDTSDQLLNDSSTNCCEKNIQEKVKDRKCLEEMSVLKPYIPTTTEEMLLGEGD